MLRKNRLRIGFVRIDNRKYERIIDKVIKIFRKIFIKIKVETIENGNIILIPKYGKYNKFVLKILTRQLKESINKYEIDELAIEEKLNFFQQEIDNIQILNGRYLMKNSVLKIFQYIFNNKPNMSLENVYIFVNECSKNNIYIIDLLLSEFKTVNIITENLRYYRRLEEKYFNKGILLTVSNNKRKSAKMAKFIIDIDFEKEKLEKYNINMEAIIINLTNEKIFFKSRFKGVIVNDFEVKVDDDSKDFIDEFYGSINKKIYIESKIKNSLESFKNVDEIYKQYNAKITDLIGIRGVIQKCEFLV